MKIQHIIITGTVATVLLLSGCTTTHRDDGPMFQAHQLVNQAEVDPAVARYSPGELEQARHHLAVAEDAVRNGDRFEADHEAYLAGGHARLAKVQAHEKVYDARVDAGDARRGQALDEGSPR